MYSTMGHKGALCDDHERSVNTWAPSRCCPRLISGAIRPSYSTARGCLPSWDGKETWSDAAAKTRAGRGRTPYEQVSCEPAARVTSVRNTENIIQ